MILVELREDRRDLALPVERVVDRLRRDPETGCGVAADAQSRPRGGSLSVGRHVLQLRQRLQFLFENRRPAGKLIAVAILKRVLVLRLARPAADLDVLPDLHEQSNPLHPAHFRLQAGDDLAGGSPALLSGLQG
jgi:hypothetical protein